MAETEAGGIKRIASNRRAFHDYTVDEKIECGIRVGKMLNILVPNTVYQGAALNVGSKILATGHTREALA